MNNQIALNPSSAFILRLPQVKTLVGLSKSTLYARIAEGSFPAPISLGGRSVGWIEGEVHCWLAGQIAITRATFSPRWRAA